MYKFMVTIGILSLIISAKSLPSPVPPNIGVCVSDVCVCIPGRFGPRCESQCERRAKSIQPNTYYCTNHSSVCQCHQGWHGCYCNITCPDPFYGAWCHQIHTCEPANIVSYNKTNGKCNCAPGFRGGKCKNPCPDWKYGDDCKLNCGCIRNNTRYCRRSGECICKDGWEGACSTSTQDNTGVTPAPKAQFNGSVPISVAVAVISLLAFVGLLFYIRVKKQRQKTRHRIAQARSVSSDTLVEDERQYTNVEIGKPSSDYIFNPRDSFIDDSYGELNTRNQASALKADNDYSYSYPEDFCKRNTLHPSDRHDIVEFSVADSCGEPIFHSNTNQRSQRRNDYSTKIL